MCQRLEYQNDQSLSNSYIQVDGKILKILKTLKILETRREIFIEQYRDLSPSGSRPGIMYGLAKVHKIVTDGLPFFRPIWSPIGTPAYKLVKFLVPVLEPLKTNEYTIKESFTFAEELDGQLIVI